MKRNKPKYTGKEGTNDGENNPKHTNTIAETSEPSLDFSVIGIGASAGGLEALQEFFRNTPDNPGVAFVIIQHLSPDYKSLMDELLARYTEIEIKRAEDGMMVKPNTIHLIPPRKNMTIFHGKLFLTEQDSSRAVNMPIDIFFRSLAQDLQKQAIGVILSGTGSDGTLGIRSIKEHGGMVIAQDDRSAKFDGMPRSSISTGMVDYILTPEEMPEALLNYIKHPFIQKTKKIENQITRDDDHLSRIIMIIRDQVGIDFSNYKESTIIRRLEKRISINRFERIEDYVSFLSNNKREVNILYKELLIGVTRFFRDEEAFPALKEKALPEIIKNKKDNTPIRIWTIGCSTGEEAYSIAILLKEYMEENDIHKEVKLFATDIDKNSIEFAGVGIYPESIVSDISAERLSRFFVRKEEGYQVKENIRSMVVFASHNILKDPPFSKLDLISCRNMLIYLTNEVQQKILSMLYFALNKEGFLFLGSSESVGDLSNAFRSVDTKSKIYKYQPGYKPPVNEVFRIPTVERKQRDLKHASTYFKPDQNKVPKLDQIFDELLKEYIPPSVIVDENYNVVHTIHNVNKFITLPVGQVSLNILKMLPDELAAMVSSLLRKASSKNQQVVYENIRMKNQDNQSVDIIGRRLNDQKTKEIYFLLSFLEKEKKEVLPAEKEQVQKVDAGEQYQERINELEKELQYTKESLQATVEELETSNEELQSSNEELIASNEELQSTNEELQSVNEELYTVNAEHQNKIEELTQLNNDMNNLLKNTNIGTLFIDSKLRIRKLTDVAEHITHIRQSDIGRPIDHISLRHIYDHFIEDIYEVLETLQTKESEVFTSDETWYLIRILPYRTEENAVDGIIITFIDITQLKKSEKTASTIHQRLQQAMEMGELAWWEWNRETGLVNFGQQKATMLGYKPGEIEPGYEGWTRLLHPNDYPNAMEAMRNLLSGKSATYDASYRILNKQGQYLWFRDKGGIVERNEEGEPIRIMGIVMNITHEKNIETEIDKTYQLLHKTLEYNPIASTIVDKSGVITFANKQAEEILGVNQEQIKKRKYDDLKWEITDTAGKEIPPEELPFSRVLKTQKPVYRYKHYFKRKGKEKRLLSINGAPMPDRDGETGGVIFTIDDITESKEPNTIAPGVAVLHPDHTIAQVNQTLKNLTGTQEDPTDKKIQEIIHGSESQQHSILDEILSKKQEVSKTFYESHLDKTLSITINPVFDKDGKLEYIVLIVKGN